jgi:predicted NUDIX family NTP pyrophosphohydrolase
VTAMPKRSAGLLLFRRAPYGLEVLLGHPGGPFFTRRDEGVWSIPKGELDPDEEPRAAALREFAEETGTVLPDRDLLDLGEVRQKSGKVVRAWAAEGDLDADAIVSNLFELEWPPRSGRTQAFPEIDRAGWFALEEAGRRIVPAQAAFLERLAERAG